MSAYGFASSAHMRAATMCIDSTYAKTATPRSGPGAIVGVQDRRGDARGRSLLGEQELIAVEHQHDRVALVGTGHEHRRRARRPARPAASANGPATDGAKCSRSFVSCGRRSGSRSREASVGALRLARRGGSPRAVLGAARGMSLATGDTLTEGTASSGDAVRGSGRARSGASRRRTPRGARAHARIASAPPEPQNEPEPPAREVERVERDPQPQVRVEPPGERPDPDVARVVVEEAQERRRRARRRSASARPSRSRPPPSPRARSPPGCARSSSARWPTRRPPRPRCPRAGSAGRPAPRSGRRSRSPPARHARTASAPTRSTALSSSVKKSNACPAFDASFLKRASMPSAQSRQ